MIKPCTTVVFFLFPATIDSMARLPIAFLLFISLIPLCAYAPPEELSGPVKSVRTYKILLRPIPAGTIDEPWLANADYDEQQRPVIQWYYNMGQEYRRHEFRYEKDGEGRERTVWVTYFITPDGRPPLRRLAGYEHWYTLNEGDDPSLAETRFETVQSRPVKSVFRYYDGEGRLIHESDSLMDLDVGISFNSEGKLTAKRGTREGKVYWEERYLYDGEGRLATLIQTDLNRQLYERGDYSYGEKRITFTKYVLDHPVTEAMVSTAPLDTPVFQSIKDYDGQNRLIRLRNYNWNGPDGLILTEEQHYEYDGKDRIIKVTEPYRRETWSLSYDDYDNWVELSYRDELNRPGAEPVTWKRDITYY